MAKRYAKRAEATAGLAEAEETGNAEEVEKFSKRTVKVIIEFWCCSRVVLSVCVCAGVEETQRRSEAIVAADGRACD